jgi:hypothetical protein
MALSPLFYSLPQAILASVIMVASRPKTRIKSYTSINHMSSRGRYEHKPNSSPVYTTQFRQPEGLTAGQFLAERS